MEQKSAATFIEATKLLLSQTRCAVQTIRFGFTSIMLVCKQQVSMHAANQPTLTHINGYVAVMNTVVKT
jgi:hypothetical protein